MIPENGIGGTSPSIKDNMKEICEVHSAVDCNMHLISGWGLLAVVQGNPQNTTFGRLGGDVVYVMVRTKK